MMKYFLVKKCLMQCFVRALFLVSLSASGVVAKTHSSELISTQTPTDRLYDIEIQGSVGFAVGEAGLIMKSTDGGVTWGRDISPTTKALTNIAITSTDAIAVGQMGEVVINPDLSGWKVVETGARERLLGVDINNRGLAVAVGAFGTLLRSFDGGRSWEMLRPEWAPLYDSGAGDTAVIRDEPTNYVVKVFDDGRVIIGGEYGQLLTSYDQGDSWEVTYRHPEKGDVIAPTIFDLKFYGETGFAAGQTGLVLVSKDGGRSWRHQITPTKASFFAVSGDDRGRIFAIGQRVSAVSLDSGNSWAFFDAADINLNWYAGLAVVSKSADGTLIAVGHSARILSLNPFL